MPKEKFRRCKKCGCDYSVGHRHTCDKVAAASRGKHVCIDCKLHNGSTLEELRAIPLRGYCKHLTPEYWTKHGYERGWGDAAVNDFPNLEILRKDEAGGTTTFLILNGDIRRPVGISFNKKTGDVDASY